MVYRPNTQTKIHTRCHVLFKNSGRSTPSFQYF